MAERFYIIDGNSYIHRAFHAIPALTNGSGQMVNAVYGFTRMLLKILRKEKPDYMAVCFDCPSPTFRHREFAEYKATRKETPDELKTQIPIAQELVRALNIPMFAKSGYEADDLIATLAREAEKENMKVVIVTSDKDALQLVDESVAVLNEQKDVLFTEEKVREIVGVRPDQIVDFMALMGDASDNVPGVFGIGRKTALDLMNEFGGMDGVYENLASVKEKIREKLEKSREKAFLSRRLVKLVTDVPLDVRISSCRPGEVKGEVLQNMLQHLGFRSLMDELVPAKEEKVECRVILEKKEFEDMIRRLGQSGVFSVDLGSDGSGPEGEKIKGIALSIPGGESFYIPPAHEYPGVPLKLPEQYVIGKIAVLMEDEKIRKCGHDIKKIIRILRKNGISPRNMYFDTMIASYVLNPSRLNHDLQDIVMEFLKYRISRPEEPAAGGKSRMTMDAPDIGKASGNACARSHGVVRLLEVMENQLAEKGVRSLFFDLEMPLAGVLAEMEMNGIRIDTGYLADLSVDFGAKISELGTRIYEKAGQEFNINSPKQLSFILFEKLKLPVIEKTKTGYSTSEGVLVRLSSMHELPALVMDYRELQKLKTTYIDALPLLASGEDGRVHTSFNQTVTATGRLSSSEPNLQNIPVKTELGRKIRRAFIPDKGFIFLSCDYSQIDLRALAHISGDENLMDSFKKGEDVHTRTACEIFGVERDKVTAEMRNTAKVVNFGLSYGMSAFGLSRDLGIGQDEAKKYITGYFDKYRGVKAYIERITAEARRDGFVTTVLNRRRYITEINSKNGAVRAFAERTAVNTPVQGTSSDIIKVAMINIAERIKKERLASRLLLQIHDELLLEVPERELSCAAKLVKEEMETAVRLRVPLVADIKIGENWQDLSKIQYEKGKLTIHGKRFDGIS